MNVALVGAGLQGRRRADALSRAGDRLAVVADIDSQAAQRLAAEFDSAVAGRWEEAVCRDDVDAVLVCTPPHLHAPLALSALRQGKHVLCEKPLARDSEEARAIVAAAQESGARLKCGLNYRHHPAVKEAKRLCDEGAIGEIMHIRCRHGTGGRPGLDTEWRARGDLSGGGELIDQGVHGLDLFRWFLGDFSEAFAFLTTAFWDVAPLEDNAFVLLRTSAGQVASLHVAWTEWDNLFSFEVFGRDGYAKVEGLGGSYGGERLLLGRRDHSGPFRERVIEYRGGDPSWLDEWRDFVAAIEEGREPLGSGDDGLAALQLVRAAYQSHRSGSLVRLEEVTVG